MTSEPLELRVQSFSFTELPTSYVGGEKIKIDGLKRQTGTDVITH